MFVILQASHALGADRLDRGPFTVQWRQASARGLKLEARSPTPGTSSALAMRTVLTTLANLAEKATRNVHRLFVKRFGCKLSAYQSSHEQPAISKENIS